MSGHNGARRYLNAGLLLRASAALIATGAKCVAVALMVGMSRTVLARLFLTCISILWRHSRPVLVDSIAGKIGPYKHRFCERRY